MADITPRIAADRQVIESYGDGGFRITGVRHEGSVLVFPDRTLAWPVTQGGAIDEEGLSAVFSAAAGIEILLIGCGRTMTPVPRSVKERLSAAGVAVEPMDTGAACRTYNVLMIEDRKVAAALIAV